MLFKNKINIHSALPSGLEHEHHHHEREDHAAEQPEEAHHVDLIIATYRSLLYGPKSPCRFWAWKSDKTKTPKLLVMTGLSLDTMIITLQEQQTSISGTHKLILLFVANSDANLCSDSEGEYQEKAVLVYASRKSLFVVLRGL